MSEFSYQNGTLFCEQVSLAVLAKEFGTPLYVYSKKELKDAVQAYQTAFSESKLMLCYAVKANGNLSVLKLFARMGLGFDIVSGGELLRVIAAGGDPEKVIFSGVGKTRQEIQLALEHNIYCFNVESVEELYRINEIARERQKQAPISLRINPDVDAKTHPYISTGLKDNKFGIGFEQALEAYSIANELANLNIIGIDCHIGSQMLEGTALVDACDRILELVDRLKSSQIELHHIDLGGGIGIPYQPDDQVFDMQSFAQIIQKKLQNSGLNLILEPGRSLVGSAGVLLTRIEYIKKNTDKNFIIVDAAMNDLIRPALYQAYHEILPVTQNTGEALCADVVGPICESSDFLGKNRTLSVTQGDLLAVCTTGAYVSCMTSNYNTRARAAEILVDSDRFHLIRKRETIEGIIKDELDHLVEE